MKKSVSRRAASALFAASLLSLIMGFVHAQDAAYPTKPIRLIVPFAAGSATDVVARIVGQKLSENLGQPVVIDNRAGAGGNIGSAAIAKAPPDGYTIGMGVIGVHAFNAHLFNNMGFDAIRDFQPIGMVATSIQVLVVTPKVPVNSVAELVAYAKARPGALNFGSPGNGSTGQLAGTLLETSTGIKMTHVPFSGAPAVRTSLLAGDVQVTFELATSLVPYVKSGNLRALAVTGTARSPILPELPTMIEAGVPNFEVTTWISLVGPAGMPQPVVDVLNRQLRTILTQPDMVQKLRDLGTAAEPGTPAELRQRMETDSRKWGQVIRAAGVKID